MSFTRTQLIAIAAALVALIALFIFVLMTP